MYRFKYLTKLAQVATLAAVTIVAFPALAGTDSDTVRRARQASGSPGLAAALITSDSIKIYTAGVRRLGAAQRIERDDAFHIGSDAKAMLATVAAQEVEAGRLRWDTTIGEVLPEATASARPAYREVTLGDLLSHRAGLIPLYTLDEIAAVPAFHGSIIAQRVQFTAWAMQQAPVAPRGSQTIYSNAGYVIAAAMLERVTGTRFEFLLQARLFAPLGIHARFDWPAAADRNAPWGHELIDGKLTPVDPRDPANRPPEWANPAGNVSMSTGDLARFVQLQLRGLRGLANFLDPSTFVRLHTPIGDYAYGWGVADLGNRRISFHQGASGLFYALMIVDASNDVAAVVVANSETDSIARVATELALTLMQSRAQQ